MSKISVERCRELLADEAGRRTLEAAIARACEWEPYWEHVDGPAGGHPPSWKRGSGDGFECRLSPPPYLTTPPGKRGYGDLCLEMVEALIRYHAPGSRRNLLAYVLRGVVARLDAGCADLPDALCLSLALEAAEQQLGNIREWVWTAKDAEFTRAQATVVTQAGPHGTRLEAAEARVKEAWDESAQHRTEIRRLDALILAGESDGLRLTQQVAGEKERADAAEARAGLLAEALEGILASEVRVDAGGCTTLHAPANDTSLWDAVLKGKAALDPDARAAAAEWAALRKRVAELEGSVRLLKKELEQAEYDRDRFEAEVARLGAEWKPFMSCIQAHAPNGPGLTALGRLEQLLEKFGRVHDKWRAAKKEVARLGRVEQTPVVCLCGSTRFMDAFFEAGWQFTLSDIIVLSVGVCKHVGPEGHGAEAIGPEVADRLDELHKRKIDLANAVFVLDVGGYVGKSTQGEIDYATKLGKPLARLTEYADGDGCDLDAVDWFHASAFVQDAALAPAPR